MASIATTEIEPKEVVNALQSLSHEEAEELFFQLGVKLPVLKNIESDHRGNMRKINMVQEWLNNDYEVSWESIVDGLIKIGQNKLAQSIATDHSIAAPVTALPVYRHHSTTLFNKDSIHQLLLALSLIQPPRQYSSSIFSGGHRSSRWNSLPREHYSTHPSSPPGQWRSSCSSIPTGYRHPPCPSSPPRQQRSSCLSSPTGYRRPSHPSSPPRQWRSSCLSSPTGYRRPSHPSSPPRQWRSSCLSSPTGYRRPSHPGQWHSSCSSSPTGYRHPSHPSSPPGQQRSSCSSSPTGYRHPSHPSSPPGQQHLSSPTRRRFSYDPYHVVSSSSSRAAAVKNHAHSLTDIPYSYHSMEDIASASASNVLPYSYEDVLKQFQGHSNDPATPQCSGPGPLSSPPWSRSSAERRFSECSQPEPLSAEGFPRSHFNTIPSHPTPVETWTPLTHPYSKQPSSPLHKHHQMSHDHYVNEYHMKGYPGSHDYYVIMHPVSLMAAGSYHQKGYTQPQRKRMGHKSAAISKQNLIKAHRATANGDLATLQQMLANHEMDVVCIDDTGLTLAHTAAMTNKCSVISMLVSRWGLPLQALQLPDKNNNSPAMLAIKEGCVDVLQWLVEKGMVPLVVKDTGGETLLHHAALHGKVKCLQWLISITWRPNNTTPCALVNNNGVTPAHFAAQQGHWECLQLMIDHNYSVTTPDKENQKPIDWAATTKQTPCARYLLMHESCLALSSEVSKLVIQLDAQKKKTHRLQKENTALKEKLSSQKQCYTLTDF